MIIDYESIVIIDYEVQEDPAGGHVEVRFEKHFPNGDSILMGLFCQQAFH